MKKPVFLLLGCNKLNAGILRKMQQMGGFVVVIDRNPEPQIFGDLNYQLDTRFYEPIIANLKKDGLWEQVTFAFTCQDVAVYSMTMIGRACGLKTMSDEGLDHACSKSMMTKRWRETGLLNRESRSYKIWDSEIVEWNKNQKLIIKPDNAASSRGITILEQNAGGEKVRQAFDKALEEAGNKTLVVEEFVEGTEFTVEMLGDSYGNVAVYAISKKTHTNNAINNKIAVKLHYNCIDNELQEKIADFAIRCYQALGFSCAFGHLEILIKADGSITPVEIGARSSGYIASDLVDVVSGRNFINDLYQVQLGMKGANGLVPPTDQSSMYFFYDLPAGAIIKKECTLLDFTDPAISSIAWDRDNLRVGFQVSTLDSDNARIGLEALQGPKAIMTEEHIVKAEKNMLRVILI